MKKALLYLSILLLISCGSNPVKQQQDDIYFSKSNDIKTAQEALRNQKMNKYCIRKDTAFWASVDSTENCIEDIKTCSELNSLILALDKHNPISLIKCNQLLDKCSIDSSNTSDSIYYSAHKVHTEIVRNFGTKFICGKDYQISINIETDSLWLKLKSFRSKYGLLLKVEGEELYIKSSISYLHSITKPYISDLLNQYLEIRVLEEKQGYINNEVLLINFEQLGERIVKWEEFKTNNPNSSFEDEINIKQKDYLNTFLFGTLKSGLFDNANNRLLPIIQDDYEQFIADYPTMSVTKMVRKRYNELKSNNFINSET